MPASGRHTSRKRRAAHERHEASVLIFRIGTEWLALATGVVVEVATPRPIHSLPHRPSGVVMGLVNVRGELLICVSLAHLLGADSAGVANGQTGPAALGRLLVVHADGLRVAVAVDEVQGIERFQQREFSEVPATLARAGVSYSKAVVAWQARSIGVLDDQPLFSALRGRLA